MNSWRSDLSISRNNFITIVWPHIKKWFSGKDPELIQVEEVKDSYAELLDRDCGIDYLIRNEIGIRPVSARVQKDCVFPTITIREKRSTGAGTELAKLIKRVNSDYLYPWLHIQAYIQSAPPILKSVYAVKVKDFIKYLDENHEGSVWYRQINKKDGNSFIVIKINSLLEYGIQIKKFN